MGVSLPTVQAPAVTGSTAARKVPVTSLGIIPTLLSPLTGGGENLVSKFLAALPGFVHQRGVVQHPPGLVEVQRRLGPVPVMGPEPPAPLTVSLSCQEPGEPRGPDVGTFSALCQNRRALRVRMTGDKKEVPLQSMAGVGWCSTGRCHQFLLARVAQHPAVPPRIRVRNETAPERCEPGPFAAIA